MKREIKFRAWDKEDGKMKRVVELCSESVTVPLSRFPFTIGIYDFELMQYTGLKDKNGTEIYEGDVLNIHQFLFDGAEVEEEHMGVVEYNEASFGIKFISGDWIRKYTSEEEHYSPIYFVYGLHDESFEVIGNIYENHELLK